MGLIRRVRPEKTGIRAPLGELEQAVMRHIWPCADAGCLATEVQQHLEQERPVALTTVLTTLDRLNDKGILRREKEGKAYRYRAALSEEQLQARIVEGVLGDLISQFPQAVAAYFAQQGGLAEGTATAAPGEAAGDEAAKLADLAKRLEAMRRCGVKSETTTGEEDAPSPGKTEAGSA